MNAFHLGGIGFLAVGLFMSCLNWKKTPKIMWIPLLSLAISLICFWMGIAKENNQSKWELSPSQSAIQTTAATQASQPTTTPTTGPTTDEAL